jgi:hypothetical protein
LEISSTQREQRDVAAMYSIMADRPSMVLEAGLFQQVVPASLRLALVSAEYVDQISMPLACCLAGMVLYLGNVLFF